MKKDGNGSSYLPRKLPVLSKWKTSEAGEEGMTRDEVNTRILFAAALTVIATVFVTLKTSGELMIYTYLFTLANFAGYTYTLNAYRNREKTPVLASTAKALMLALGFTATTALAYNDKLPVTLMRNLIVHGAVFLLLAIALLPSQVTDRL
jgi:hypothetical protein